MEEKSIFKSLSEWRNSSKITQSQYSTAYYRGLIPRICEDNGWELPKVYNPRGYWTLEKCKEVALRYKKPGDWYKGDRGSYNSAQRNGWLKACCKHMVKKITKI